MLSNRRTKALFALLFLTVGQAFAESPSQTVSVLPFVEEGDDSSQWLGSAIADLIMKNLAEVPSVSIVDREKLQAYLNEMELHGSGFVNKKTAVQVGRIAKATHVLTGKFSRVANDQLQISMTVVDVTSTPRQIELRQTGSLANINQLTEKLALGFAEQAEVQVETDIRARIKQYETGSVSALEHYYRGVSLYEKGDISKAFAEFLSASRVDPQYYSARIWMGRCLSDLGKVPHAVAVFSEIYQEAPSRTEGLDALLLAAQLEAGVDPERAEKMFQVIVEENTRSSHSLYAAYQLAELKRSRNDLPGAYQALAHIVEVRDQVEKKIPKLSQGRELTRFVPPGGRGAARRASLYAPWKRALLLYRKAIQEMAVLYGQMMALGVDGLPGSPPRGVFVIDPSNPEISIDHQIPKPSMFHERMIGEHWRDDFYVMIMPPGFEAEGADIRVKGRLYDVNKYHDFSIKLLEFPLPVDPVNDWLGVIYGQSSQVSDLSKRIPFYGRHLQMFAVRITENYGKVYQWSVQPRLVTSRGGVRPGFDQKEKRTQWSEGQLLSRIPFQPDQHREAVKRPENEYRLLTLVEKRDRSLQLVASLENPDDQRLNLYSSASGDGKTWSSWKKLPVSSHADDVSPQIVVSEDGKSHLFWLSNRRGKGWELWTSESNHQGLFWTTARRIDSADSPSDNRKSSQPVRRRPWAYSVVQTHEGDWLLSYQDLASQKIVISQSTDTKSWQKYSGIRVPGFVRNLALGEDATGGHHLAALVGQSALVSWRSYNARIWERSTENALGGYGDLTSAAYSSQLLRDKDGNMTLFYADRSFGVQYSELPSIGHTTTSDLVRDANLLPFAATMHGKNRWILALATNRGVDVREYQTLHAPLNGKNPASRMIYRESEQDSEGRLWDRIFARPRVITPDVTAVAVADSGRLWWGIETGIMTLHKNVFLMRDVAEGFFHHNVTQILPCAENVAFIAGGLAKPIVGISRAVQGGRNLVTEQYSLGGSSPITQMACVDGRVVAGTLDGHIRTRGGGDWQLSIPGSPEITALFYEDKRKKLWVGTAKDGIYVAQKNAIEKVAGPFTNRVSGLVVDAEDMLWAAVDGEGVYRRELDDRIWKKVPGIPYRKIGGLAPGKDKGIWITPSPYEISEGLIYHDGMRSEKYEPPSQPLAAATDLAVAPDGSVWVGTPFHGLYRLKVNAQ